MILVSIEGAQIRLIETDPVLPLGAIVFEDGRRYTFPAIDLIALGAACTSLGRILESRTKARDRRRTRERKQL